jgi:hypothetical protein
MNPSCLGDLPVVSIVHYRRYRLHAAFAVPANGNYNIGSPTAISRMSTVEERDLGFGLVVPRESRMRLLDPLFGLSREATLASDRALERSTRRPDLFGCGSAFAYPTARERG